MNKKCKQCRETKDIYDFARTRDNYDKIKYLTVCKSCKSYNVSLSRKAKKEIEVVVEQNPLEQAPDAFKDDPRAVNEIMYGKVTKRPTYLPGGSND